MTLPRRIALIGDFDAAVTAHQAIPQALQHAAGVLSLALTFEWVGTKEILNEARIAHFDGLWCVPASPYQSMKGALRAIRFAREQKRPFLGTCGGFQHAIVEYARNVLGWADADHAETAPSGVRHVISPLACALIEASGTLRLHTGSRMARAYASDHAIESYRCRYGLNHEFQNALLQGPLRIGAVDENGDVRAVELDNHPFFVATLFQPERVALSGQAPPLVVAFVRACAEAV